MTAAELKTYAEIAESIFKIAALILAGVWAVYGLIAFRQRQSAITSLRKTESEVAGLALTARRRAVLDITINCESRHDIDGDGYILSIQVVIANNGVSEAWMQFPEDVPSIRVQRVDFDASGVMRFPDQPIQVAIRKASDPKALARSRLIRAGGTSRLPAVVRVPTAGIFAVSFHVPMDEANSKAMIEAGAAQGRKLTWSATTFVYVGIPGVATGPSPAVLPSASGRPLSSRPA